MKFDCIALKVCAYSTIQAAYTHFNWNAILTVQRCTTAHCIVDNCEHKPTRSPIRSHPPESITFVLCLSRIFCNCIKRRCVRRVCVCKMCAAFNSPSTLHCRAIFFGWSVHKTLYCALASLHRSVATMYVRVCCRKLMVDCICLCARLPPLLPLLLLLL